MKQMIEWRSRIWLRGEEEQQEKKSLHVLSARKKDITLMNVMRNKL